MNRLSCFGRYSNLCSIKKGNEKGLWSTGRKMVSSMAQHIHSSLARSFVRLLAGWLDRSIYSGLRTSWCCGCCCCTARGCGVGKAISISTCSYLLYWKFHTCFFNVSYLLYLMFHTCFIGSFILAFLMFHRYLLYLMFHTCFI